MKRYLVFTFAEYYPSGGWRDFVGDYNGLQKALEAANRGDDDKDIGQVVDTQADGENRIVRTFSRDN